MNSLLGDIAEENNNVSYSEERVEKLIKLQLLRFARKRKLRCKNGLYLEIRKDGSVQGTKDGTSPYTSLQILSIGSDMIAIWGTEAMLYVSVDGDGKVHTTDGEGRHCVFIESFSPEFYNIYESYHSVYNEEPRCLIMKDNGQLEMNPKGILPGRSGQFTWEIYRE